MIFMIASVGFFIAYAVYKFVGWLLLLLFGL